MNTKSLHEDNHFCGPINSKFTHNFKIWQEGLILIYTGTDITMLNKDNSQRR